MLKTELHELEDSHVSVASLCRVLRYRAPDRWSKQDEEEVIYEGPNVALGRLQDMVHQRPRLWLPFVECLRMLNYTLKPLDQHLPVTKCVLWFVPSPVFAAKVVKACSHSKSLEESAGHTPFFWPSEQCDIPGTISDQFLYRYCALYGNIATELVLVYPQDYSATSIRLAVKGALSKWNRKCSLVIYSTVSNGPSLFETYLANDTPGYTDDMLSGLRQADYKVWLNPPLSFTRERYLFHRMILIARQVIDTRRCNQSSDKSQLIDNTTPPNPELLQYMKGSRLWVRDETTPIGCGLYPGSRLERAVTDYSVPLPDPSNGFQQLKLVPTSFHNIACPDVHWFMEQASASINTSCPIIVCGCVNGLSVDLTSRGLTDVAIDNCCHLSIQCVLNALS